MSGTMQRSLHVLRSLALSLPSLLTKILMRLPCSGNGLKIYMMCEIPSNALLAESFLAYFDGFSIGTNDLTQLTLGLERDSELVSHVYDERNDAVKALVATVIQKAKANKRKIGICGQSVSDYPEFAQS